MLTEAFFFFFPFSSFECFAEVSFVYHLYRICEGFVRKIQITAIFVLYAFFFVSVVFHSWGSWVLLARWICMVFLLFVSYIYLFIVSDQSAILV